MSFEPDIAKLQTHMNSKLFRKFIQQRNPPRKSTSPIHKTPNKPQVYSESKNPTPRRSMSPNPFPIASDQELQTLSMFVDPQTSMYLLDQPQPERQTQYYPPSSPLPPQAPTYQQQLQSLQASYQKQLKVLQESYEDSLLRKEEQYKKLQKTNANLKLDYDQLQQRLNIGGEVDRKFKQLRNEISSLQSGMKQLQEQNVMSKKHLEQARNENERLKIAASENQRYQNSKSKDLEREVRELKEIIKDQQRNIAKLKNKKQDIDWKLNQKKQENNDLRKEIALNQDRIQKLQRELADNRDQSKYDSRILQRENQSLKRQIESLNREIQRINERQFRLSEQALHRLYQKPPRAEPSSYSERSSHPSLVEKKTTRAPVKFEEAPEPQIRSQERLPQPKPNFFERINNQQESIKHLESQLLNVQWEKKRLEDEFVKIPQHPKQISAMKRRKELEDDIKSMNREISSVKSQLRHLGVLH